jgi:hypothetical protein
LKDWKTMSTASQRGLARVGLGGGAGEVAVVVERARPSDLG